MWSPSGTASRYVRQGRSRLFISYHKSVITSSWCTSSNKRAKKHTLEDTDSPTLPPGGDKWRRGSRKTLLACISCMLKRVNKVAAACSQRQSFLRKGIKAPLKLPNDLSNSRQFLRCGRLIAFFDFLFIGLSETVFRLIPLAIVIDRGRFNWKMKHCLDFKRLAPAQGRVLCAFFFLFFSWSYHSFSQRSPSSDLSAVFGSESSILPLQR